MSLLGDSFVLIMSVSQVPDVQPVSLSSTADVENYEVCRMCVEELALYLKPISGAKGLYEARFHRWMFVRWESGS